MLGTQSRLVLCQLSRTSFSLGNHVSHAFPVVCLIFMNVIAISINCLNFPKASFWLDIHTEIFNCLVNHLPTWIKKGSKLRKHRLSLVHCLNSFLNSLDWWRNHSLETVCSSMCLLLWEVGLVLHLGLLIANIYVRFLVLSLT